MSKQNSGVRTTYAYFSWEGCRFTRPRNLVILAVFLILILFFVNQGIDKFLALAGKEAKFKDLQQKQFKSIPDYSHYSVWGIDIQFLPAPISALVKDTAVSPDLSANVNSLTNLEISTNMKGKTLARGFSIGRFNFASILWSIGALLALLAGYETLHTGKYRHFLFSLQCNWKVLLTIFLSRFFLFALSIAAVSGGVLLFIMIRGVTFSPADYRGFLLLLIAALAVFLVFFTLGFIFSFFNSLKVALSFLFGSWIILTVFVPSVFISMAEDKFPDAIKDLQANVKKLEINMEFEKKSREEHGKFDRNKLELFRRLAEGYWKNEFPKVINEDRAIIAGLDKAIETVQRMLILTPPTFYLLTCSEVSSCGYDNFLEFYRRVLDLKIEFTRFWLDRVFYHDPKQLVSFIKANENLFRSQVKTPRYYAGGLLIQLGISLVLVLAAYPLFLRHMFPRAKNPGEYEDVDIRLNSGKSTWVLSHRLEFYRQLLNIFYGRGHSLKMKIYIDGREVAEKNGIPFVYLSSPDFLPEEIKGVHLLNLFKRLFRVSVREVDRIKANLGEELLGKRFKTLDGKQKIRILVMICGLSARKVYMLDKLTAGVRYEKDDKDIDVVEETLKGEGISIVDIGQDKISINSEEHFIYDLREGKYKRLAYK